MNARRRKAVLPGRKHRNSKPRQFVRLWIDKHYHEQTNNYRRIHGLPMLSKGEKKRAVYIVNFLRCYNDLIKERGTDE